MKILAIVGSPRTNGNTYQTVRRIADRIAAQDPGLQCEIVQLSATRLEPCRGCYVCLARGEDLCPLRDERDLLENKMKEADGVIFATPVYTYNVSGTMKNFLDRFAYRCHRPEFSGKKAMVVATTGAVGLWFVERLLSFMVGAMGFVTCAKAGLTFAPAHERNAGREQRERRALDRQTDRFLARLNDPRLPKPSPAKQLLFRMQKKGFGNAPKDSADYRYWNEKGWLNRSARYYYDAGR